MCGRAYIPRACYGDDRLWEKCTRSTAWGVFAVWEGESARVGSEHITRTRDSSIVLWARKTLSQTPQFGSTDPTYFTFRAVNVNTRSRWQVCNS